MKPLNLSKDTQVARPGSHNNIVNLSGGSCRFSNRLQPFLFFLIATEGSDLTAKRQVGFKVETRALGDKRSDALVKEKRALIYLGTFFFFFFLGGKSGPTGQGHMCQNMFRPCGQTGKV